MRHGGSGLKHNFLFWKVVEDHSSIHVSVVQKPSRWTDAHLSGVRPWPLMCKSIGLAPERSVSNPSLLCQP